MNKEEKRQQKIIELAQSGGTDKDLSIIEHINELEDKFDAAIEDFKNQVDEKVSVLKKADLIKIKGDKGDKGDPGKDGVHVYGRDGKDGKEGPQGKPGRDGKDGEKGPKGDRGDKGDKGKDGLNGKNGTNGRDGRDGSPDKPDEIVRKINSATEKIKGDSIEGYKDLDRMVKAQLYTGVTETRVNELIRAIPESSGGGSPAGSTTEVQFNDSGSFGSSPNFTFDPSNGGAVYLAAIDGTGVQGGGINIYSGSALSGNDSGGFLNLNTGSGNGSGNGGSFSGQAGSGGDTGRGGNFSFSAGGGGGTSGNGGSVFFSAGNANSGNSNGGDIEFVRGIKSGSGVDGVFAFQDGANSNQRIILDINSINTSPKTFTFPNQTAIVATSISGSGAPGSTPVALGQIYVDTSGGKAYISTGTTNSGDWKILN